MKREQHRMTNTPEYRAWSDMRSRCNNPKATGYGDYGGRGIKCCAAWDSFLAFYADMGRKPSADHSIERMDVNGPYGPQNCRWATKAEQAANKRNTVYVQTPGGPKRIPELAATSPLTSAGIRARVKAGRANDPRGPQRSGWFTLNGVTDTMVGWSRRTGIKASTIAMRLTKYRWPIEKALTKGATQCAPSN